jgi:hypothetical protein
VTFLLFRSSADSKNVTNYLGVGRRAVDDGR